MIALEYRKEVKDERITKITITIKPYTDNDNNDNRFNWFLPPKNAVAATTSVLIKSKR